MLRPLALYLALACAANAGPLDGLLTGEMAAVRPTEPAAALPSEPLLEAGEEVTPDFSGKPTVLNFWATWCAPCRVEMPHLAALAEAMPEANVALVAMGRNDDARARAFLEETGAEGLRDLRDPTGAFSREAGVRGLPTTLVLDASGHEVARLVGIADWSSEDARTLLRALVAEN